MAYQMTVTLSDQEYAALTAKAAKSGKQPETLLHEIMTSQLQPSSTTQTTQRPMTGREFMEQQYREGKILNLPTRHGLTHEQQVELERLGRLFSDSKPLSDIVIEDRGPY